MSFSINFIFNEHREGVTVIKKRSGWVIWVRYTCRSDLINKMRNCNNQQFLLGLVKLLAKEFV